MSDCFYGAQFDPGADIDQCWVAIKVYRDGNPIELGRFSNEDDAQACAQAEYDSDARDNSQFGLGA